jgi:2-polyprenyl-6-methoxyphenol hydroxylase-like FAD-dependent oxidoreductase
MPSGKPDDKVLIIGAGPTGCTLALLLARSGIATTLIEQEYEPQQHPAATILNTRTMEVFREVGIEEQIRKACQNIFDHALVTWVVSLAGRELGRCSAIPDNLDEVLALSPSHTVQFPQHRLESMLWRNVQQHPSIEFKKGHRVRTVLQNGRGVSAVATNLGTGDEVVVGGPYLVACDGASSQVRRSLGVVMDGPVLQNMIGIHFEADLGDFVNERKSILYWILNRTLIGVLIAHWLPTEWVLFAPYFPPQEKPEQFTPAVSRAWIRAACGFEPSDLKIKSIRPWVMAARLARSFRQDRVFLAGDAAHSFPPTGGFGLNTGVQDSHNLAWKLAALLKRQAQPGLLDTYESERRPVARVNLDHSVRNFAEMIALYKIVGLDWTLLKTLARVQSSRIVRRLPSDWQLRLVRMAVSLGLKPLGRLEADGLRAQELRKRFCDLLPGQEPHYRFLGLDLGFAYTNGAIVSEQTPKPEAPNPIVNYRPTTWPGARLPHVWVRRGAERLTLLDLPAGEKFLLLTNPPGKRLWLDAVGVIQKEIAFSLECISIGPPDLEDELEEWPRVSEIQATGAILIRPDGHVAWRCLEAPFEPVGVLMEVMKKIWCSPRGL